MCTAMISIGHVSVMYFVVFVMVIAETTASRVGAKYQDIPACYRVAAVLTNAGYFRCNNPLYTTCWSTSTNHLCCGPNQYCCLSNLACCRDESWNAFEITSVVTGSLAWVGILFVLGTCLGPTLFTKINKRIHRFRVHPEAEVTQQNKAA